MGSSGSVLSASCFECPVYSISGCSPVLPTPAESRCEYLFIGDAPSSEDYMRGSPFSDEAGKFFLGQLVGMGIDLSRCAFANAVWCVPRDKEDGVFRSPTKSDWSSCAGHVYSLIASYRPSVVIAVGPIALSSLAGSSGVRKFHGQEFLLKDAPNFEAVYEDYHSWVAGFLGLESPEDASEEYLRWRIGQDFATFWKTRFDVTEDRCLALDQVNLAQTELGYVPLFWEVPVVALTPPEWYQKEISKGNNSVLSELQGGIRRVSAILERQKIPSPKKEYSWINSVEELKDYVDRVVSEYQAGIVTVASTDIETTRSEEPWMIPYDPESKILTIQISTRSNEGVAIMVSHRKSAFRNPHDFRILVHYLKKFFSCVPQVGQNFAFDATVLRAKLGIRDIRLVGDTKLMHHWLTMGTREAGDLDSLGAQYLGTAFHKREAIRWLQQHPDSEFDSMPLSVALDYGCGDSDVTLQLYFLFRSQLEGLGLWEGYYDLYHGRDRVWDALTDMSFYGLTASREMVQYLMEAYPPRIQQIQEELLRSPYVVEFSRLRYREYVASMEEVGSPPIPYLEWSEKNPFNPSSFSQVFRLWSEVMRIPFSRIPGLDYRKTGGRRDFSKPSTNAGNREKIIETLEHWCSLVNTDHSDVAVLLAENHSVESWRETIRTLQLLGKSSKLRKLYTTYVQNLSTLIRDDGSKPVDPLYREYSDRPPLHSIHPTYKMDGTGTGRLSSSNPNGQNIPVREMEPDLDVRLPYISRYRGKGGVIVYADYSQMEVRGAVMECGDEGLAQVIDAGEDIHLYVASLVYGKSVDQVTKEERTAVKSVTFGLIYGQTVQGLAAALGKPLEDAQQLMSLFFSRLPKFQEYVDRVHFQVRESRQWVTKFGRIRHYPDLSGASEYYSEEILRQAVNMPIQSQASDMNLSALGRTYSLVKKHRLDVVPWNVIHDSIMFDSSAHSFLSFMHLLNHEMTVRPGQLWDWVTCRLEADFGLGIGWGYMVDASLVPLEIDDPSSPRYSVQELDLFGSPDPISYLLDELRSSQEVALLSSGPHPKEEEAEKGKVCQRVRLSLPSDIWTRVDGELVVSS